MNNLLRECFDDAAPTMIAAAAEGIPRTINLIARAAWCEASKRNDTLIRVEHVQHALKRIPIARDRIAVPART